MCRHKRYGSKQPSATCYKHTDRSQSAKVGTQQNRVNSKGIRVYTKSISVRGYTVINHGPAYSTFEHTPGEASLDLAVEDEYGPSSSRALP